jgi:hypothetical protein
MEVQTGLRKMDDVHRRAMKTDMGGAVVWLRNVCQLWTSRTASLTEDYFMHAGGVTSMSSVLVVYPKKQEILCSSRPLPDSTLC